MSVSGKQMNAALDKLQEYLDQEFTANGWTPAEITFMLNQLSYCYHEGFDRLTKPEASRRR